MIWSPFARLPGTSAVRMTMNQWKVPATDAGTGSSASVVRALSVLAFGFSPRSDYQGR